MNQNPLVTDEAIVAHLFYAAAEIGVVTVQVGRAVISGTLMIPEAEPRSVGFCPDENEDIPEKLLRRGRLVRLRYASLVDEYAFQAAYLGRDGAGWRLSVPHTVDRKDRRLLPRRTVLNSRRFTVQLDGLSGATRRLIVVDLSPAGFSVLVDPRLEKLVLGETRKAKLFLPDRPVLMSRCTVVNVRPFEGKRTIDIVGCCFVGLGFSSCGLLAELLKEWR
jgi:hypothetical protein